MPGKKKSSAAPFSPSTVAGDFNAKYLTYIPEAQRSFFVPDDLRAFLEQRREFFSVRTEQIKIRAYNPGAELFWMVNTSVVEIAKPDTQFIIDTILDYCSSKRIKINQIIHPVFEVRRDANGLMTAIDFPTGAQNLESYVYLEIARLPERELESLRKELHENLLELDVIIADYPRATEALDHLNLTGDAHEDAAWTQANLVVLGSARLKNYTPSAPFTGILRKGAERRAALESFARRKRSSAPIEYFETDLKSRVNPGKKLYFVVFRDGERELLFVGHFARRAEFTSRFSIPAMRRRLAKIAREMHAAPTSFLQKRILNLAQMLPIEILFTRPDRLLRDWFVYVSQNIYTDEMDFALFPDDEYGVLWVLVILPRREAGSIPGRRFDAYAAERKVRTEYEIRGEIGANQVLYLGITRAGQSAAELARSIGNDLPDLFATWNARFRKKITNRYVGDRNIASRMQLYFAGLSPEYEIQQTPEEALFDLDTLEDLAPGQLQVYFYERSAAEEDCVKIYSDLPAALSDLVPVLTNFGFKVLREYTFPFASSRGPRNAYAFIVPPEKRFTVADRSRVAEAIAAVLNRKTTSDILDRLSLSAGLNFRELILIKALMGYYWQIDRSNARLSLQNVFTKYPAFTAALVRFFKARFQIEPAPREEKKTREQLEETLQSLNTVVEESICRNFIGLVEAIVRTNFFLEREELSFKIRSSGIANLPRPVPLFEIYVFGYDVEGIHLRGGRVARGGLRWSDRVDDYRTEILGLMKAQMVKNTVIVPEGSKGGFVLKNRNFADQGEFRKAGVAAYKRYIKALLELTDNVHPDGSHELTAGIRALDEVDPYLVVAADKGTATFSDIANEIAVEHGFWLLDAFASGGANGYDHKRQGITARGAWQSVLRHFLEMGVNPEREKISAIGIGDMSGDVFGNGFLLSRSMQLVAAFNHVLIFLDPDPDPEVSWKERKRLFEKIANWDEYDRKLISKGGGVFERASRRIELSAPVRERLGVKATALSGEELIKAILRAPVDLLWNGGIGTYIKAGGQSHFQAGDPTNDRVRVDAGEVRARVIAEGGNLGLTQAARVEAADRGIRLNTDAIDNSGGVDMSDHEVNLKILLNPLVRGGKLTMPDRNRLIRRLDEREIELVLKNNFENNLALSVDDERVPEQFAYFRELIKFLNREGILSREADSIPFEADLDRIEKSGRRLSRPVLSSLMGFTKLYVARQLAGDPDSFTDPWYDRFINRYFPADLSRAYGKEILAHPLKREIIITLAVNQIVNQAGIAYFQNLKMRSGQGEFQIADTYLRLAEFLDLSALRASILGPDGWLRPEIHYRYLILLQNKVFTINRKLLEYPNLRASVFQGNGDFKNVLARATPFSSFRPPRQLRPALRGLDREAGERTLSAFRRVEVLEDAFNIYVRQREKKTGARWKVSDYFQVTGTYRIPEVREAVARLKPSSPWEILFLSKIEMAIDALVWKLLEGRAQNRPRIHAILAELFTQDAGGTLSTAAAFEMLEQAGALA